MLGLLSSCFFSLFFYHWSSLIFLLIFFIIFYRFISFEFSFFKVRSIFECDVYSLGLILLSIWLIILSFLARYKIKNTFSRSLFLFVINSLFIFLVLSFSLNNYMLFYLRFECSIIPITFLVIGWGYQPERTQAGLYLIFYTLAASLPLLVLILRNSYYNGSCIGIINFYGGSSKGIIIFFLLRAFLVKFPMYITHLWLPKAHVEAPVAGSIILAGILLKLGGYGIIRFVLFISEFPNYMQTFLILLSVFGGLLVSLVCINHVDIKSLVAYSSVVHISTCISCILTINDFGFQGAYILIIAHGLRSSGLFFLIGLIYERRGSRRIKINKGLINIIPSMCLIWFVLLATNIAAPPFINLLAEINIICCILSWDFYLFILLGGLVFFRGCYRLYIFSLSQHGKYLNSKQSFLRGFVLEYIIGFLHIIPLLIFIFYIGYISCFFSLFKNIILWW